MLAGRRSSALCAEHGCIIRPGNHSPTSTPEELERRAEIQRNDLLLHEAVIKNDTDGVRRILKDPVDINSRNNYGRAPLHWASSRGNTDIMDMLISGNCDIEARDKYGMRPILMAAWHGHRDAVQLLINSGACTNATNKKNYTLLMCAAKNNRLEVVDYLLETLEDVNIDAIDIEGQTALFHASSGGHIDIVKRLIDIGAALDRPNKKTRSALHAASEKGHSEVTQFLLNHEGHVEARDSEGNTPLCIAAQNQQMEVAKILLEHGADPDAENNNGFTPLHIACSSGSQGIIEALVQQNASLNTKNKAGNTPLHLACQTNRSNVVEFLIAKGADLNALNVRLQSPIHIAAEMGHVDICKLLLSAGANIEQREQGGRTPLYIAARGSFTAIVDMIIKTARLDYPPHEEPSNTTKKDGGLKPVLNTARIKMRSCSKEDNRRWDSERFRGILFKLAYKQLSPGEWKRLAHYWAFTEEQIRAIEHQYTGPSSYKEHGYRMMLIWVHGLPPDANPIKEIYDGLTAIDKRPIADALRRKLDQENEERRKGNKKICGSCSIT